MVRLAGIHEFRHAQRENSGWSQTECLVVIPALIAFAPFTGVTIGAAMAFDAIVEIADAFLDMFRADFGRGMFVAAIAGVTA